MKSETLLRRLDPPKRRLIIIGDIHGCHDELSELLDLIDPTAKDMIVSTGDIVRKGPDPVRCVELWRSRGYLAVAGNNEEKVLALADGSAARRLLAPSEDRAVLRKREVIDFIRTWPVVIDLPGIDVTVVHGGLYPGTQLKEEAISRIADDVIRLRWIRRDDGEWRSAGKTKERNDDVLWADVWKGPRTVVYGHTPLRQPRVDRYAIGLDTGCVYGGFLTAAIYDGKWTFERVRARRQYAD